MTCVLAVSGASLLHGNALSAAWLCAARDGHVSSAVVSQAAMLTWFIIDYLAHERAHLYTFDLFAERCGAKLFWGCLCFYPYAYAVGSWAIVLYGDGSDGAGAAWGAPLVFLAGYALSRGANNQKFAAKASRGRARVFYFPAAPWLRSCRLRIQQRAVPGSGGRLLCSGFWSLSRHVNYLGEVLMALGIAAPAAAVLARAWWWCPLPWLYPLYYVALLGAREAADSKLCAGKYGRVWEEYTRLVPCRIVPGVW